MKNFILSLVVIAFVSAVLQQFLLWWIIAVVAFMNGYFIPQKTGVSFLAGFVAIFFLWVGYAYLLSSANSNLLAGKVAELFKSLTGGNVVGLYLLTGCLGGLVAGFASMSGALARGLRR